MGLNHGWRGPNIVRDGLVLYLDAGSPNSYQGTGTTWKDISKVNQNNGTLTNGPTFNSGNGGSIVFDGVNDYVIDSTVNYNDYKNNFTAVAWVKPSIIRGGVMGWGNGGNSPFYTWTIRFENGKFRTQIYNGTNYFINSDNIQVNEWYNVSFVVYQSGLMELYVNNVKFSTTGSSDLIKLRNDGNNRTIIGVDANTSSNLNAMTGNISSVQIYNRALSANEVLQNYNATKGRFGL
jgi:hypothetical protein